MVETIGGCIKPITNIDVIREFGAEIFAETLATLRKLQGWQHMFPLDNLGTAGGVPFFYVSILKWTALRIDYYVSELCLRMRSLL
ncbi:MAG: hypothetical protein ACTJHT_12960 [Sphingobacterium sp.]|uniref:hypothetical protein n=1 Tax=Sphingobacterium sp. JB170 TaxID=1434842 RepID=UPI00097F1669|nr:hypothetical protein [Sphingobacterium sp. JB170]SJN36402.1 hypothetical protein FM107_08855 [Sphingobacterium sp. JB170]